MAKAVQRVELRLNTADPVTQQLQREASDRGVSLAEHIADLLKARYLGTSWVVPALEPHAEPVGSAAALADAWM
jgi:hypothetical protein